MQRPQVTQLLFSFINGYRIKKAAIGYTFRVCCLILSGTRNMSEDFLLWADWQLWKELSGDTWTRSTRFRTHGDADRTSNYVCLAVEKPIQWDQLSHSGYLCGGDRRPQVQCWAWQWDPTWYQSLSRGSTFVLQSFSFPVLRCSLSKHITL